MASNPQALPVTAGTTLWVSKDRLIVSPENESQTNAGTIRFILKSEAAWQWINKTDTSILFSIVATHPDGTRITEDEGDLWASLTSLEKNVMGAAATPPTPDVPVAGAGAAYRSIPAAGNSAGVPQRRVPYDGPRIVNLPQVMQYNMSKLFINKTMVASNNNMYSGIVMRQQLAIEHPTLSRPSNGFSYPNNQVCWYVPRRMSIQNMTAERITRAVCHSRAMTTTEIVKTCGTRIDNAQVDIKIVSPVSILFSVLGYMDQPAKMESCSIELSKDVNVDRRLVVLPEPRNYRDGLTITTLNLNSPRLLTLDLVENGRPLWVRNVAGGVIQNVLFASTVKEARVIQHFTEGNLPVELTYNQQSEEFQSSIRPIYNVESHKYNLNPNVTEALVSFPPGGQTTDFIAFGIRDQDAETDVCKAPDIFESGKVKEIRTRMEIQYVPRTTLYDQKTNFWVPQASVHNGPYVGGQVAAVAGPNWPAVAVPTVWSSDPEIQSFDNNNWDHYQTMTSFRESMKIPKSIEPIPKKIWENNCHILVHETTHVRQKEAVAQAARWDHTFSFPENRQDGLEATVLYYQRHFIVDVTPPRGSTSTNIYRNESAAITAVVTARAAAATNAENAGAVIRSTNSEAYNG